MTVSVGCAAESLPDDGYPYPAGEAADPSAAWAVSAGGGIAEVEVDGDGAVYAIDENALFAWSAEGTLLFEQAGLHQSVAATASGVVAARDGEVVRLDPEGTVRWHVAIAGVCSVHVAGGRVGVLTTDALQQRSLTDGALEWTASWGPVECGSRHRARLRARPVEGWFAIGLHPRRGHRLVGFDMEGQQDLLVEIPVLTLRDLATTRDGYVAVAGVYQDRGTAPWGGLPDAVNHNAFGAVFAPHGELVATRAFQSDWFQSASAIGSDGERFVIGGMFNEQNEGLEAAGQRLTAEGEGEIGWIGAIDTQGHVGSLSAVGSGGQLSVTAIAHSPRGRWVIAGVTVHPTEFEGTRVPGGGFVWVGPTL